MSHITQAKAVKPQSVTNLIEVWFFDKDGLAHKDEYKIDAHGNKVSLEDHLRYGKEEVFHNGKNYFSHCFIKRYKGGRTGETLVDPLALLGNERDLSAYNDQWGSRFAEYIPVNLDLFKTYHEYLQTKNPVTFRNCERRVLDGEAN
jgi:hypothetical protein